MKSMVFALLVALGALLTFGAADLPTRGDIEAPVHTRLSTTFMQGAEQDANTPNIVTVILADYRGYDTFGEAVVIFVAGVAAVLIVRKGASGV